MQSVTLIIDKRKELPTKYKKLLDSKTNKVIISKNLISAMKLILDKEPDLIRENNIELPDYSRCKL